MGGLFLGSGLVNADERIVRPIGKVAKPSGIVVEGEKVKFKVTVPSGLWSMSVSEAYAKGDKLYIVCDMKQSDGFGTMALKDLPGEAKVGAKYVKLKPEILLRGASWNWQKEYKRVTDEELKKLTEGATKIKLAK